MANPYALEQIEQPAAANDSGNPYALGTIEADSRTQLRGSLLSGQSANPDQTAEAVKLSRKTGSPYEAIQANLPEVQQGARLDDYEKMLAGAPATRKFLTAPQNAAMANDDVGGLTAVEQAIRDFMGGGGARIRRPDNLVMNSPEYAAAVRRARIDNPALDDDAARSLVMNGAMVDNQMPRAGAVRGPEASTGTVLSGLAGAAGRMPETFSEQLGYIAADVLGLDKTQVRNRLANLETRNISGTPQFDTETGRGLYAGGVSTIQNAPGLALSIATGNPAIGLGMSGAQSAVPAYSKYRERGASGTMAAVGALGEGAVEVATELLPMQSLLKVFGKGGAGAATQFLKSQFQEQWTEQIATVAQDAIDTAIANPNKTWGEFVAERPGAAYQTFLATLVQTGAVTIAHTAAQKIAGRAFNSTESATRAEEAAAGAESLTKLAEASKLRARDPESFAAFVNQVAEDGDVPAELFIDGDTLTNTLNQAGITMERLAMVAPAVAAQLRAASFVPGADIRVPVAEFAAAGADITTPLIDHLRETPDAMSRAEAQEYLKTEGDRIQADVETELGKMGSSIAARQDLDKATARFEAELTSAGRFRPEVNKAYAGMMGNFYATQAARAGMPLEDFLQKYQLRVTGKTGQGAQTLEQSVSDDPQRWATYTADRAKAPGEVIFASDKFQIEFKPAAKDNPYGMDALQAVGPDGKVIGTLDVGKDGNRYKGVIQVAPANRRQGIASALYREAEKKLGVKFTPDTPHTADAAAFWAQPNRQFGEQTQSLAQAGRAQAATNSIATTVERAQAAVADFLGSDTLPNALGRVVTATADDIKATWEPLIGRNVQMESEGDAGAAQAFYDPASKTVFLIADNIRAGDEAAVLAHELMHKHGQAALGKAGWDKLHGVISTWANAPEDSDERAVYQYASSKVRAVGEQLSSQEMFPYAVEAALKMGLQPSKKAKAGTVSRWLNDVQTAMKTAWDKVTGKPEAFGTQDLVNLAYGIAQMENPALVPGQRAQAAINPVAVAQQSADPETGLPQFAGSKGLFIGFAAPTERLEFIPTDDSRQMLNFVIMRDGQMIGSADLLFEGDKLAALYDIELDAAGRGQGDGAAVIQTLMGADPLRDVEISNIVESARNFWESVGVPTQNLAPGEAYDGTLNWQTYLDSRAGQRAARANDGAGAGTVPGAEAGATGPGQSGDGQAGNRLNQGEGAPRATLNFASDITQAPSVIALLEGADLSSFLHESGHFFLEVQADLAARIQLRMSFGDTVSEAERGIVEDMNTLLAWFGVTDMPEASALDQWALKTLDERREAHETFARGFERYAMEGKAPTQELAGLFNKFRSWLVSIYQKLANLNVTLTDDVRGVMDRMLASDEAIAEAQAARNMGPLFQSPEQAGMTPAEYDTYQFLGERATAAASEELDARLMKDMKWLSRAKSKAIKAAQAEADDIRRDTEREVRAEVMAQPIYRAWAFLTGKQDPIAPGTVAPADITGMESGKLRTSLVKNIDAEAWSRLSERRMTSEENGMDPDLVAEVFEFTSGDELVRKLAAAPPPAQVIAEQVDQLMMERYGDITSAEALSQAADEAVHNELRARVIATELKALLKAGQVLTGDRNTTSVLAKAAKEYAAQVIARQRVRDLRPSQYTAAEARSAKLAEQALGKDMAEAALHKRNQLINNYAARAAYDAQDEVKAMQAYFRKFDKRRDSIDAGYQDQIEALLERFDFKPASLKAIDKRKSFAAWYEEAAAGDNPPDVPEYLLDEASRKSYKDMTVEELRGLRDTVKQIEHQGRLKNKLLLARDQRDFDAAATAMADSIVEHGGEAREVNLEGPNPVTDWFAGVAASHRKLASLFRQMDGNKDDGPMYDLIGRGMNERGTMEDVMVEKATVALRDIYAPLLKMRGGITGARSKLYIPEIDASLTRGGRLAVALNWGNEANRQRIMDGDKWSAGQVQAILKTLSPVELKFVNDVWAYIDSYWEDIAAKEKRLTGVAPEKVLAEPFTVMAADGTEVQMTGGYYPLKYDTDRSDRADTQEAAQAAKEMMQGVMTRSTTRRGHTKERLKEVKRAVRKDLNVITQHITQVTHDLAFHEWLIDTNKLLKDERVVSAIRDHYGPKVLKTIRDDVLGIATADVVPQTDIDKALLTLRGNVTRATMGASITTAFLQPFGLTQSMVRIGPQHVLRGMARWGGDAARMENTVEWIREKSEFMRLRSKTFNKELREIRGSVAGKSATMRVVDAGLFALMQKMQLVADVPTWIGQYEKSTAEGLDEAAAVAMADRAVLESQGGGATKDLAEVQRKHPMLTQFYSYFSVTLNLAAEQTAATDFKNPAAVAGWLGDMALLMVIPAILPAFIMFALKGGDEDDEKGWAKRIAEWQLGYLMGTIVGVRELSGAVGGFDYAGPPVSRIITDIGKAGQQTIQGEVDEPAVMAYIRLMGTAFGIPITQALRSYKGWKAWDEGQEGAGPQSVLFGPPPKD